MCYRPLKSLRLPFDRYLIDMFFPECHLRFVGDTDPIVQAIRVHRIAPECAIFYLGDLEIDRFGALFLVLQDYADYAIRVKVA